MLLLERRTVGIFCGKDFLQPVCCRVPSSLWIGRNDHSPQIDEPNLNDLEAMKNSRRISGQSKTLLMLPQRQL